MRRWLRRARARLWAVRGEVLHAAAILLGWTLVTWAGQDLVHARWDPAVWKGSAGLLLLSLAGWRHLRTLFGAGLYRLWKGSSR